MSGAPSNGTTHTRGKPCMSSLCASNPHRRMNVAYSDHETRGLRITRAADALKFSTSSTTNTDVIFWGTHHFIAFFMLLFFWGGLCPFYCGSFEVPSKKKKWTTP